MDQQTTNRIAVIKTITISCIAGGSLLALVLLAAFRDGAYAQLVTQYLPQIILASLGVVGGVSIVDGLVQLFQTKYTAQQQAQTTTAQAQAQAQIATATGTPPPPASPVEPQASA